MTKHANLEASSRVIYEDHHINGSIDGADFRYAVFKRLGAKSKSFKNSRFDYVIFEDCYVRNWTFEDCTFIGCIFRDSQFDGSRFEGCDFKYAQFENSWFDEEILQSSCPSWDNTKRAFARSLRTNYRSLGDARLESKAAKVEIEATGIEFVD